MRELDDSELLQRYVEQASEEAFAVLVERHINKIYSVAWRYVADQNRAEEITQAVFVILAKKSAGLLKHTCLSAWLYQTARLTSVTFLRSEIRRTRREQEACMQSSLDQTDSGTWRQIAPLLDDAVANLRAKDREALVLHFFDGKSMRDVGSALALNENAAKKRVNRAVEKLRTYFAKRGISSSAAIINGMISTHSVQAAPAVLAKSVTTVAITKGVAASTSTLTLINGALTIMAWTKAKTAIVAGVVVLLVAGTTIVTVEKVRAHKAYSIALDSWRVSQFKPDTLTAALPQTRILPTKFKPPVYGARTDASGKWIGVRAPVRDMVRIAYDWPPGRLLFPGGEPKERYDFAATEPFGTLTVLRDELKNTLGLTAKPESRETDVLLLRVRKPALPV